MVPRKPSRTKIFISYSHQDAAWLERLRVHLKPLEPDCGADIWDDTRIQSGARWREEIRRALESAGVAILLVSADFLASDFIASNELPPLLKAAEEEGTVILPLILSPSGFKRHQALSEFQAFNDPSRPLINMSKGGQEALFEKVAERVVALSGAPPHTLQRKAQARRSETTKRFADRGQPDQIKVDAGLPHRGGGEMKSNSPAQEDATAGGRPSAVREKRIGTWPVIAAIGLAAVVVSMAIVARHFKGTEGMPDQPRSSIPAPRSGQGQMPPNMVKVIIENGGAAGVLNDSLNIHIDGIKFDKGSNQYLVSFRITSARFNDLKFSDRKASAENAYFYPADGKFEIKLLSVEEDLAEFSVEERVN